jgi:hypothetical protein
MSKEDFRKAKVFKVFIYYILTTMCAHRTLMQPEKQELPCQILMLLPARLSIHTFQVGMRSFKRVSSTALLMLCYAHRLHG